jgi:hypothetical protein
MIKHIALFTLKDEAEGKDKEANITQIVENVHLLASALKSYIHDIEVARHYESDGFHFPAADLAVVVSYRTEEDYLSYVLSPEHKAAAAFAASVSSGISAITYNDVL